MKHPSQQYFCTLTIEEVILGFKREQKADKPSHNISTEEGRRRWRQGTRPDPRSTCSTVQKLKVDAFKGASQAFTRRFEVHQDLIDEGRAHRANEAAEKAAMHPGLMRIPKGWPSLREWHHGAPLPPDDGGDLEY